MMPARSNHAHGFALPMTLVAIGGLTLLLVGLMTLLSLERKTARSYSDATRAELAVESGLAVALADLGQIAGRDDAVVFRLEDPVEPRPAATERPLGYREQFFTFGAVFENGAWQAVPCFSGGPAATLGTGEIDATQLDGPLRNYAAEAIPIGRITSHDQSIPRARWVELPATPGDRSDYTIRYAYWVEDLEGRLPGRAIHREPRREGRTTGEIDPSTLIDPTVETGAFPAALDQRRDTLRTPGSLRSLLDPDQAARLEPYLHYLPPIDPLDQPRRIPQGFGYADAGQLPPDLNAWVAGGDVEAIAEHVRRNLPQFEQRAGGFPASDDYLKTLAASIIDYADADSDATVGPDYRGIDAYPFVNELFDRYEWVGGNPTSIILEVESFVELWNPTNQTISGSLGFLNQNRHQIRIPLGGTQSFSDSNPFGPVNVVIPPNGFLVLSLGAKTYRFPTSPSFPPSELIFNQTTNSNFQLTWNGALIDRARGGLQRTSGNLRFGFTRRKWKGHSSPALDYRIGQMGDPRASYYIDTWVYANNYDENSNWGGRALKRDISNPAYNEVRLPDWPDGGSNSTPGVEPGTDARIPTDSRIILKSSGNPIPGKEYPPNQPEMAPAVISNAGRFHSLGELGNIYDPAQIRDVNSPAPVGDSRSGGGLTLAIGRPEFGAFDREGQRAAQLLDLFSLQPDLDPGARIGRRINLNTAPREVLRSLVAAVPLDDDPATPGVTPPREQQVGDRFADYVLAHRAQRPLRGLSDLNGIRTDPSIPRNPTRPEHTPFFGSREAYPPGTAPPSSWDDAGREELLRQVLDLVHFNSRSFRIVVTGEVVAANGEVQGRATREYHYSLAPRRDPTTGEILRDASGRPLLDLLKYYEKSL